MKIRILDKGFANLTGLFGTIEFVDGVSVDEVSKAEAARLGTILSIECADSGVNPSTTQLMVDTHAKNTEELGLKFANLRKAQSTQPEVAEDQPEVLGQATVSTQTVEKPVKVLSYDYTVDELDALVSREGIAGLRAFADQYDVNDRSVAGLVQKLLDLKALHQPVAQEPVADVAQELFKQAVEVAGSDASDEEKTAALAEIQAAALEAAEAAQAEIDAAAEAAQE